jgi:ADP-heptose:LPS heptosyltransferase
MHLLVIRTSAMGDVALTIPVISAFRKQYPGIELTIVTRSTFKPFFISINGLHLYCPDFSKEHNGLAGIIRLYRDLSRSVKYDYVIDLHDVLRSKVLGFLFRLKGIPVFRIDKGKGEKRDLIRGKIRIQLKHSVDRYCDVFSKAGFPVVLDGGPWIIPSSDALEKMSGMIDMYRELNIGVAPFAKHDLKVWPEDYMVKLLTLIDQKRRSKFFLFGGLEERERLKHLQGKVVNSIMVSGSIDLEGELALMSRMNFMITMDSSNMHMTALVGTKVVSIWGGTDPLTGFGAWGQPDDHALRIEYDVLTCRPCSVFGKGKCLRGDFACMIWLTSEKVFEKMVNLKII